MTSFQSLGDEKYVRFTTFTRDGREKPTPVWIADLGDGAFGFTTGSYSWKVKRLAHTSRVLLQPSDARGNPLAGSAPVEATAKVVRGQDFERVRSKIKAKYGVQFAMVTVIGKLAKLVSKGSGVDCAVVVSAAA